VYLPHFPAGRISVLAGSSRVLNSFHHDLVIEALQSSPRPVVFLDGAHCLNVYDFAERNFQRGNPGDFGADRSLLCRAMTPFQWAKMLTTEMHDNLSLHEPSLVVAAHFDLQFNKDDLVDWEQLDYVGSCLRYLRRLAHLHKIPIVLTLDLARWTRTHPAVADLLVQASLPRREVVWDPRGFSLLDEQQRPLVLAHDRLSTLDAWVDKDEVQVLEEELYA
jgi:hypothetical protein